MILRNLNFILVLSLVLVTMVASESLWAQAKMDLDDISIKGELHNDDRLRMLARESNRLRNYVKYRTNFRPEMVQGLMRPEPKVSYQPLGEAVSAPDLESDE